MYAFPRLACAALMLAAPADRGGATPTSPAPLGTLTIETLPSGLRLVLVPSGKSGVMAYYTLVRVGSRNEVEPGHSGFAHLFEHMMFRGTETRTADQYTALVASLGLESNAYTTDDNTVYYYTGPSAALPQVIELEADRFQHLHYSKEVFQTETKAVLGEYNKNFSDPTNKMLETLQNVAYTRHTYKHTTMGFLQDILQMPWRFEYSLHFFRKWYQPDNCTVFVVGDFDPKAVGQLVRKHYGAWRGKAHVAHVPEEPPQTKEHQAHVDWMTPTHPRLMVGYHTPAAHLDNHDAAIQTVLAGYLFGPTSELHRTLVLEKQIAVSLDSLYDDHRDPWLFGPLVTLKQVTDLPGVQVEVASAIAALRDGKVDTARFAEVQSNTRYSIALALETPSRIAAALAQAAAPSGDPEALVRELANIAAVTPDEAVAFAKKYFVDTNRTVVTLSEKGANSTDGKGRQPGAQGAP